MISIKIWETLLSWHANCSLPVAVHVSKTRVLKLPNYKTRRSWIRTTEEKSSWKSKRNLNTEHPILVSLAPFSFGQHQEHGIWPQPKIRAVAVMVYYREGAYATGRLEDSGRQNDEKMSRKIGNAQSRATFFRHSAVLSLPAVLLRKLPNNVVTVNDRYECTECTEEPEVRISWTSCFGCFCFLVLGGDQKKSGLRAGYSIY